MSLFGDAFFTTNSILNPNDKPLQDQITPQKTDCSVPSLKTNLAATDLNPIINTNTYEDLINS